MLVSATWRDDDRVLPSYGKMALLPLRCSNKYSPTASVCPERTATGGRYLLTASMNDHHVFRRFVGEVPYG